ncbi:uncharacterized protein LOC117169201 [Belonocnema kinseyi]|uniref:uncharacterized protein LOC117169201 n=1 Tax=Belonocnema kinseyi TaxID=2817044 RepID=UPI00143DB65B|nr:uncharacterized protein LOC117169201 [Belonocnema kinseyi]
MSNTPCEQWGREFLDISQEFSFGTGIFETTGHFDATDGYFSDLTTLKRSTDAALEREGLKFSIACGFGLSKARIEYNDYKLKFGIIKVDGTVSGNIDGIFIDMKFSVDYNQQPCKAKLEYLKNTQLGRLDVQVTGLSPLNFLASYLATLIATQWEGDITTLIETKVSEVINYQMNHFDCEKYRPFTY